VSNEDSGFQRECGGSPGRRERKASGVRRGVVGVEAGGGGGGGGGRGGGGGGGG